MNAVPWAGRHEHVPASWSELQQYQGPPLPQSVMPDMPVEFCDLQYPEQAGEFHVLSVQAPRAL